MIRFLFQVIEFYWVLSKANKACDKQNYGDVKKYVAKMSTLIRNMDLMSGEDKNKLFDQIKVLEKEISNA